MRRLTFLRLFGLLLIFGYSFSVWAVNPETVRLNNKGVEFYQTEQYYEAYKNFTEGIATEPFDPYLQSNLAMTFLQNEEKDKAFSAFKAAKELADQSNDEQAKFITTFNLATMKANNGDIDGALDDFQLCLEMRPGDQMVRENIEKMWQSQQSQGEGGQDSEQDQKNKDKDNGEGNKDQEQQQNPKDGEQPKEPEQKKPKPFDSKELTKDDVRKILEELKNQEQKIRAEVYEGQGKDKPRDKDW